MTHSSFLGSCCLGDLDTKCREHALPAVGLATTLVHCGYVMVAAYHGIWQSYRCLVLCIWYVALLAVAFLDVRNS